MIEYDNIETKGAAAMAFVVSGTLGSTQRQALLNKHGIGEIKQDSWYDFKSVLNAFKDLSKTVGEMNLFLIGKTVMEQASFPPMDGLENALRSIDIAYHMNHRKNGQVMFNPSTGEMQEGIGHYTVDKFDEKKREAVMICSTPYPSKFEEGLIVQVVRQFKPKDSLRSKVILDDRKENRNTGGETCTFLIIW